jgi:protein O-GlcNAc transferase
MSKRLTKARALAQSGRLGEAAELIASVCREEPGNAEAWFMHGILLGNAERLGEAVDCLRQAVKLQPGNARVHFNLGNLLSASGRLCDAAAAYEKAQILAPDQAEIARNLARVEVRQGRPAKAAEQYRRYLRARPDDACALANLGTCYFHLGELEAAASAYREALQRQPEPGWMDGLAATLCRQGKISEALEVHREVIRRCPEETRYRSNLLLSMNYLPGIAVQEMLKEHRLWHQPGPGVPGRKREFDNTPDPGRRLRIGYVSADFRTHSVAYFIESLFDNHDDAEVETYAYACSPQRDVTTERLQAKIHHWRDLASLDDAAAFARIQNDAIDILVDLSGHTAGNRLPLFRAKPAPIQITYLGYPATTGLDAMDYRLTDWFADPSGHESHYSEQLIRVPGCFLCYTPPSQSPPVAPPPAVTTRYVTFGSFNNQAKINEEVIALWSRLLNSVPDSRLLLKNPALSDPATADYCRALLARHAIDTHRVELLGLAVTTEAHLDTYRRVDIALDTFPYNGTTTTCEALWMGVPVIALAGHSHAGRVGVSLLTAVGLHDLVGGNPEDYLARAATLAGDTARLTKLRQSLHDTMKASLLCDGAAFARKIESAYRNVWNIWCSDGQKAIGR